MINGTRRIIVHNLGCKTNRYDADAVLAEFVAAGFVVTSNLDDADVCIVNTCTVTGEAGRKSLQILRRFKRRAPKSIVVAMGCHAKLNDLSDIADLCFGINDRSAILPSVFAAMAQRVLTHPPHQNFVLPWSPETYEDRDLLVNQSETRAHIKIQDGCDAFCSYCIIPFARGRVRSRSRELILSEAKGLVDVGYKELVLTGIHICSFEKEKGNNELALATLVNELSAIDGDFRIRLGSLDPSMLTEQFVALLADASKLCPHFHLSLQSGSNTILKQMHRNYVADDVRIAVANLRKYYRNPALTSDVIVGFPGEETSDYEATVQLCKEIELMRIHIFRYSKRQGTKAASMPNQVKEAVKVKRSKGLQKVSNSLEQAYIASRLGQTAEVLIETQIAPLLWQGTSEDYLNVHVEVSVTEQIQGGECRFVTLIAALDDGIVLAK